MSKKVKNIIQILSKTNAFKDFPTETQNKSRTSAMQGNACKFPFSHSAKTVFYCIPAQPELYSTSYNSLLLLIFVFLLY